jgi:two-component system alkaline phosphatase synthesis response regulator PhoP
MKILLIEDEEDIASAIEFNFRKEGFEFYHSIDGIDGFEKAKKIKPDIIILDVILPSMDGFSILRKLKLNEDTKKIPVIMLTARDSEIDKITGLELGADDYVSKPFSIRELLARVKAVARRYNKEDNKEFRFKDLYINFESFEVKIRNEKILLTTKEFLLLKELINSKNKVLTREYLLNTVWNVSDDIDTRTVDVHIMTLRKKLKKYSYLIETIKNIGYKFNIDEKDIKDFQE